MTIKLEAGNRDEINRWRDMKAAERGAILLARYEGCVVEVSNDGIDWEMVLGADRFLDSLFYRVQETSFFLPLEAGKVYTTARGDFECIFVDGRFAWMKMLSSDLPAHTWMAKNGGSVSLPPDYKVTGFKEPNK